MAPIVFVQACDSAYAAQGLALYRSLERHMTGDWRMEWYCLDNLLWPKLLAMRLPNMVALGADSAKYHRHAAIDAVAGLRATLDNRMGTSEWLWTWASQATHHAIEAHPEAVCVYIDTDTLAFGDLRPAIEEVEAAGADVGMIDHRWPAHKADRVKRGDWWVGLNVFASTIRARACAAWWAAWVRARCETHGPGDGYLDIPPGLAGDQEPLSAFTRIAKVHNLTTPGLISTWNWDDPTLDIAAVRLAHFHEFRFEADGTVRRRTGYDTPPEVTAHVVEPYEAAVRAAAQELASA